MALPCPRRGARVRAGTLRGAGLVGLVGVLLAGLGGPLTPAPGAASSGTAHPPGATGIGDAYFPLDGNGGYDVQRYDVALTYRPEQGQLTGRTRLVATTTEPVSSISLDLLLPVRWVKVAGRLVTARRSGPHEVRVPVGDRAAGSRLVVEVSYAGYPGRVRWLGERGWHATRREAAAVDQPHAAPWWAAVNDHPRDRALLDLSVRVPRGQEVVAGGDLLGHRDAGSWSTWRWRHTEPVVPYLASFVVGRFAFARGVDGGLPWLTAVSEALPAAEQRRAARVLRLTPSTVRWLEGWLGDYPFSSTGGVATSVRTGFALESQTRPVYDSFGVDARALLVHELAHQWFGDSVAVHSWRDIWVNEGLASWAEQYWAEQHGGPSAATVLRRTYDAHGADDPLWATDLSDPGADHVFDEAVYVRGAMAVEALRARIGTPALLTVLRTWVARYAGRTAGVADFRALAQEVSGEDLGAFFDAWLVAPRKPADTEGNGLGGATARGAVRR